MYYGNKDFPLIALMLFSASVKTSGNYRSLMIGCQVITQFGISPFCGVMGILPAV